jgi:hypothetical protein
MVISFVGSASNRANNGNDVTLDLTTITGLAENDIVIVAYAAGDNDDVDETMAMTTSGYTKVADLFSDDDFDTNFGVFWKVMGETVDTTAVTSGVGGNDTGQSAVCMVFRGVDTTTPMDVTPTTATGTNSILANPPSIDYNDANAWVVATGGGAHNTGINRTYSAPANYDDMISNGGNDTSDSSVGMCYRPDPGDPEDPGAFTWSDTDAVTFSWCAATLALREAVTVQDIEGTFHTNNNDIFHGLITLDIEGHLLEDTDDLFHGLITHNIEGHLLEDADSLFHGEIGYDIAGSLFEDSDQLFHGLVEPQNLFGSLYQDPDNLYHGLITLDIQGSLFEETISSTTNLIFPSLITRPSIVRPSGLPQLNRASPQAEGLIHWWPVWREEAVFVANVFRDRLGNEDRGANGFLDLDTGQVIDEHGHAIDFTDTIDSNIEISHTFSLSYPLTFVAYCTYRSSTTFGAIMGSRASGPIEMLEGSGATANQLVDVDFDGTGFDVAGPALPTNEFIVCAVNFHGGGVRRWVASGGGLGAQHRTKTHTTTSATLTNFRMGIGVDNWDGLGYDFRIYNRNFTDAEIWPFYAPQTRWDLYWTPKTYIPGITSTEVSGDVFYHGEVAIVAAADQNIQGTLHTETDNLYHGLVEPQNLFGSLFSDADNLYHGLITLDIQGSLFEETITSTTNLLFPSLITRPSIVRPDGVPVLNRASPQADGLVGWWPLNGDLRDYSEKLNHGTGQGKGSGSPPTKIIKDIGKAFDFEATATSNGSSVEADWATLGIGSDGPFSMAVWVEIESNISHDLFMSIGQSTTDESCFFDNFGGNWRFSTWGGTAIATALPAAPAAGVRVLLTGTYDQSNHRFYTNGVKRGTSAESSLNLGGSGTPDARFGGTPGSGGSFLPDAHMWHGMIWNRALSDAEVWSLYNPATRWDLYWQPKTYIPGITSTEVSGDTLFHGEVAIVAAGDQNIQGTLHTDVDTLYHGLISPQNLFGSLFEDTDDLFHGLITYNIEGSLLQDADQLFHGLITHNIEGSLLTDEDVLYHGQIDLDITGSLFADSDTLFHGLVEPIAISGSLFQDADDLFHGLITYDIAGSLFEDTDDLFHGLITYDIAGSLFQDADDLFHGLIEGGTGDQNLEGSLFTDDDNLFHGLITLNIEGHLLEDADQLFHGQLNLDILGSLFSDTDTLFHGLIEPITISGSLFQDADQLFHGLITHNIEGSLFTDTDDLFHGLIEPTNLFGSLFQDADDLFHGEIAAVGTVQNIEGSLFQDADILYHGLITHNIEGSLLQDTDTLFHGQLNQQLFGSLLEDTDTLFHGLITYDIAGSLLQDTDALYHGDISPQQVFGSILTDADTLYHGKIGVDIEGSLLDDPDILFHGLISIDIQGSLLEDADILYHGSLTYDIQGSLLEDADNLYHGEIAAPGLVQNIEGSLLQDADNLYHGDISPQQVFGSLLTDADTLYHGEVSIGIQGSLHTETSDIKHGLITSDIEGSLLQDPDDLYHGIIQLITGVQTIAGSLYQDPDIFFHGEFASIAPPPRIVATGLGTTLVRGYDTVSTDFPDPGI